MGKNKKSNTGNIIFYSSFLIIISILTLIFINKAYFKLLTVETLDFLITNFGFLYLIVVTIIAGVCIFLCCSKYGNIKLGKDDSKPEYSNISWFSMLFSAGMGVGLIFFGVAEPMSHYIKPVSGISSGSKEAINFAFKTSFFHWGVHPWAVYSFLGMSMAYFQFRKSEKGLVSSTVAPIVNNLKYRKYIKMVVDMIAILATITGVATTLGMGTLQINSGLNYLFNIPNTFLSQFLIIIIVSIIFIYSAINSLDRGIKLLSNLNIFLAIALLILVIVLGPTVKIFNVFSEAIGNYLNTFLKMSLKTNAFGDKKWISHWTIFYWSTWIAWTPFVGSFIARISKGRTIREFIIGVILLPSLFSFLWFSAFGTLGIELGKTISKLAIKTTETAIFVVYSHYQYGFILSLVTIFLLCSFFITSADSATYVLGIMSSDGDIDPPKYKKFIWGVLQSLLAIALIFMGGLDMLKTASIIIAFPLLLLFPIMIISFIVTLKKDIFVKKRELLKKHLKKLTLDDIERISTILKNEEEK